MSAAAAEDEPEANRTLLIRAPSGVKARAPLNHMKAEYG